MAVVEVGSWCTRAGYVGDAACTRVLRSLCATARPDESDFMSLLRCAATASSSSSSLPPLLPLWSSTTTSADAAAAATSSSSLSSFAQHPDVHTAMLRHITHSLLGCRVDDPLLLVLPETWFAQSQLPLLRQLCECVLDDGGVSSWLYCMRPSVACALSMGCASAVVLDVGHSHCTTAAVLDGYALRHTVETCPVGGAHVTAQLMATLSQTPLVASLLRDEFAPRLRAAAALQHAVIDAVSDVKHAYGFVRAHAHSASGTAAAAAAAGSDDKGAACAAAAAMLQLPDGTTLTLSDAQRSDAFELLFARHTPCKSEHDEGNNGKDKSSHDDAAPAAATTISTAATTAADHNSSSSGSVNVADMLVRCKQRLDPEWRVRTVQHIVAGATARTRGFAERLLHEATQRDAAYVRYARDGAMHVTRSADAAWVGASLAAASSSFAPLWVSRDEWHEEGTRVLCRKLLY